MKIKTYFLMTIMLFTMFGANIVNAMALSGQNDNFDVNTVTMTFPGVQSRSSDNEAAANYEVLRLNSNVETAFESYYTTSNITLNSPSNGSFSAKHRTPNIGNQYNFAAIVNGAEEAMRNISERYGNCYSDFIREEPALPFYNGISYCLYDPRPTNEYWIEDANYLLNDEIFTQVNNPVVGAIVCFNLDGVIEDVGIVSYIDGSYDNTNLDNVYITSKIGVLGVFYHPITKMPLLNGNYQLYFYTHTHTYNFRQTQGATGHTDYCFCGEWYSEGHTFAYSNPTISNHTKGCTHCSYHTTEAHVNSYTSNNLTHTSTCGLCGYSHTSRHWIRGQASGTHAVCAECGRTLDLGSEYFPITPNAMRYRTPNGSYIHPSGYPVIVEADVEAYLNGTLVFGDTVSE